METEKLLARMVQVGSVAAVDNAKRMARVKFRDTGILSAWLRVLKSPVFIPSQEEPPRTEFEVGGSGDSAFQSHKHDLVITPWMPAVNDAVLVLYLPVKDGDGYILGGI